ncbi:MULTISPECIES: hypothetical protein [Bacteroides]|uniref:hypothetical protein n=1 Tax=Bacteroides TaxID=816 RepID=UPI0009FB4A76|nr:MULTISPECIES: hypothetical protein [Bacteroides]MDC7147572.1 hypothetical protein [Bacteroides ovatus]
MNNYQLFKIETWEKYKPSGVDFTHVFYTDKSGEVRKVKGTITVMKSALVNGKRTRVPGKRKVYWDGYGRCYVGTHNMRKRNFDIPLNNK